MRYPVFVLIGLTIATASYGQPVANDAHAAAVAQDRAATIANNAAALALVRRRDAEAARIAGRNRDAQAAYLRRQANYVADRERYERDRAAVAAENAARAARYRHAPGAVRGSAEQRP